VFAEGFVNQIRIATGSANQIAFADSFANGKGSIRQVSRESKTRIYSRRELKREEIEAGENRICLTDSTLTGVLVFELG